MTGRIVGALALMAIIAILSPTLGTVFDHHTAERVAGHGHVYYGRPDLRHRHGYETPHADTRPDGQSAEAAGPAQPPSSVVVVPATSAAKDGSAVAEAIGFAAGHVPLALSAPPSTVMPPLPGGRPSAVFLSPPYTPPRTLA
jgi:hypothetical protein